MLVSNETHLSMYHCPELLENRKDTIVAARKKLDLREELLTCSVHTTDGEVPERTCTCCDESMREGWYLRIDHGRELGKTYRQTSKIRSSSYSCVRCPQESHEVSREWAS